MKNFLGMIAIFIVTTNVTFSQTTNANNFVNFKFVKPESFNKIINDNYSVLDESDFLEIKVEAIPAKVTEFKSDDLLSISCKSNNQDGTFYFLRACADLKIRAGLFYPGGDCAVWGTFITDEEGTVFIPGSPATQALMNVCGLSNVCKTINR